MNEHGEFEQYPTTTTTDNDELERRMTEAAEALHDELNEIHEAKRELKPPNIDGLKYSDSPHEIQGPRLDSSEPYFILRGNDALALIVLEYYIHQYVALVPMEGRLPDDNYKSLLQIYEYFRWYNHMFSGRIKNPD